MKFSNIGSKPWKGLTGGLFMRKENLMKWLGAVVTASVMMVSLTAMPAGASTWSSSLPNIQTATNEQCTIAVCGQFDDAFSLGIPSYMDFVSNMGTVAVPSLCYGDTETDQCPDLHDATGSTLQSLLASEFEGIDGVLPPGNGKIVQIGDGSVGDSLAYYMLLTFNESGTQISSDLSEAAFYDSMVQGNMSGFEAYVENNIANGNCAAVFGSSSTAQGVTNQRIACYGYWELETYNDLYNAFIAYTSPNPPPCYLGAGANITCVTNIEFKTHENLLNLDQTPGALNWTTYYEYVLPTPIYGS
jgi:hypothetical protein